MKNINKPILIIAMVFISVMASAQQIYRWVDASGQTHFTDDPALAVKNKAKSVSKPTAAKVNTSTTLDDEDRSKLEMQRQNQEKIQQVNNQRQLALQQYCGKLSTELAYLKKLSRIADGRNADGSFRIMSDQERDKYVSDKQMKYKTECGR